MANLLILCKDLPFPLEKGGSLRMYHPCHQLAKAHTCILVAFGEDDQNRRALESQGIFKEIHMIRPSSGSRSFWRHFRWSDKNFTKLSTPGFYHETVGFLNEQIQRHHIDVIILFPALLTEFVEPITNVAKIADCCDSTTLTYERQFAYQKEKMSTRTKLTTWLMLQRVRNFEKMLPDRHDRVISISPADLNTLKALNPAAAHKLKLIPNGVHAELLAHTSREPEIENSVAFWGNLKFTPNHTAIHYFYRQVYQPYLAKQNVKWYIVGSNADNSIRAMGERDPNIIVTGFVERLYDLAARIPIMINPMQIGSGMKNKVLEAFALRRTVVSTALGVEAILGVEPGVHYANAEHPKAFAEAILYYMHHPLERRKIGADAHRLVEERYSWDKIGDVWRAMVEEIVSTDKDTTRLLQKKTA